MPPADPAMAAGQWGEAMTCAIADVAPQPADMAKAKHRMLEELTLGMGRQKS